MPPRTSTRATWPRGRPGSDGSGGPRARAPAVGEEQGRPLPHPLAHGGVDLVAVAETVDEAGPPGLLGRPGPGVDERADLVGGEPATRGDGPDGLVDQGAAQALQRLPVRGRQLGPGDAVDRVLVLVATLQLRLHAELVERPAQERRLERDAEEVQVAARLQPELVERARQHVRRQVAGPLPEALRPRDGGLAAGGERRHPEPELLGERPRQGAADLGDEPHDAAVGARLVQRPQQRSPLRTTARAQPGERVPGRRVGGRHGQVDLEQQRAGAGHGRPRSLRRVHPSTVGGRPRAPGSANRAPARRPGQWGR